MKGKVAIITGGASEAGFGAATSRRFAKEGAQILIGDLDGDGAAKVAKSIGEGAISCKMDVSSESDWKQAVEMVVKEFGKLDIIVNNAGTTYKNKPTLDVTEAEYMRCFDVNVKSIFWASKIAIPQLQKQGHGGAMINISSIGSVRPRPGLVWYNSSKGAVSNVNLSGPCLLSSYTDAIDAGNQRFSRRIWARSDSSQRHLPSPVRDWPVLVFRRCRRHTR